MPTEVSFRITPANWLDPIPLRAFFARGGPLEVDVGCGKGRFLLARAAAHPETLYLGIDRMLRRIRKIDHKLLRRGMDNVRLLRLEAYYAVSYLMPPAQVSVYYIFFPDPWPKQRHHAHRLFNEPFLNALHRTLVPGGQMHFATDHQPYFEEVRAILLGDPRFEEVPPFVPAPEEQTDFELYYVQHTPIGRISVRRR